MPCCACVREISKQAMKHIYVRELTLLLIPKSQQYTSLAGPVGPLSSKGLLEQTQRYNKNTFNNMPETIHNTHSTNPAASDVHPKVQQKAPAGVEERLPENTHPTGNPDKVNHSKGHSYVPNKIAQALPTKIEQKVPDSIHDTSGRKSGPPPAGSHATSSELPPGVQNKAPGKVEDSLPNKVHDTGNPNKYSHDQGHTHVPQRVAEGLPTSVERGVPDAIHDTSGKKSGLATDVPGNHNIGSTTNTINAGSTTGGAVGAGPTVPGNDNARPIV